jgi:methyl-accepting chemotaxis protein
VRHTVRDVKEIGDKLGQIIGQVEVVTHSFASVNQGMASQAEGVQQINEAMDDVRASRGIRTVLSL